MHLASASTTSTRSGAGVGGAPGGAMSTSSSASQPARGQLGGDRAGARPGSSRRPVRPAGVAGDLVGGAPRRSAASTGAVSSSRLLSRECRDVGVEHRDAARHVADADGPADRQRGVERQRAAEPVVGGRQRPAATGGRYGTTAITAVVGSGP